jgi:hypothetical protein
MDSASIRDFVTSAQSAVDESPQMVEATTKAAILGDFIELLGWEIPSNTELEYTVEALGKKFRVDYALLQEGRPMAFLEAKGLDTNLTEAHRKKLADYMKSENVDWGILANGMHYEFYMRQSNGSKVSVKQIEATTLDKLPQKEVILQAYTAESLEEQDSGERIEWVESLREASDTLTSNKTELANEVVDTLTDSIPDAVESFAESHAKEMIDRIASDVASEIGIDHGGSVAKGGSSGDKRGSQTDDPDTDSEVYRAKITDGDDAIHVVEHTVQARLMVGVADQLVQEHNLISEINPLPYIPGDTRAIINDATVYDGEEMKQPEELDGGYYLEKNLSWTQKQREMERMAEACGLDVDIEETTDS